MNRPFCYLNNISDLLEIVKIDSPVPIAFLDLCCDKLRKRKQRLCNLSKNVALKCILLCVLVKSGCFPHAKGFKYDTFVIILICECYSLACLASSLWKVSLVLSPLSLPGSERGRADLSGRQQQGPDIRPPVRTGQSEPPGHAWLESAS